MRVMAYLAVIVFLVGAWGLWLLRRKTLVRSRLFLWAAVWVVVLPFLMNTAGWLLTESGRQPWIVQGLQQTKAGVSPSVSTATVAFSLSVFVLLYAILAVVEGILLVRYARKPLPEEPGDDDTGRPVLAAMTY